jgi:hypothetical protein
MIGLAWLVMAYREGLRRSASWLKYHFGPIDPHKKARAIVNRMYIESARQYENYGNMSEYERYGLAVRCLALAEATRALCDDE